MAKHTTDIARHGDISLHPVSNIPKDAKLIEGGKDYQNGNFILARGETTNHFHKLLSGKSQIDSTDPTIEAMFTNGKFKIYETEDGVRYVEVLSPTPLVHEEHRSIVIPAGIYEQKAEIEEDPFSEAAAQERIRTVLD
jgi:hypothetical protein